MCDSLVGAEQAVEEDRDQVDSHLDEDSLQRCQIVELKKRNKALEARIIELSDKILEKEMEMQEIDMGRAKAQVLEREAHKEQEREAGRGLMEALQQQGLLEEQNRALVEAVARSELKDSADEDTMMSLRSQVDVLEKYVAVQEDVKTKDEERISRLIADYRLLSEKEKALRAEKEKRKSRGTKAIRHRTDTASEENRGRGRGIPEAFALGDEDRDVEDEESELYEGDNDSEEYQTDMDLEELESDAHHHTEQDRAEVQQMHLLTNALCLGLKPIRGPSINDHRPMGRVSAESVEAPTRKTSDYSPSPSTSPLYGLEGPLDADGPCASMSEGENPLHSEAQGVGSSCSSKSSLLDHLDRSCNASSIVDGNGNTSNSQEQDIHQANDTHGTLHDRCLQEADIKLDRSHVVASRTSSVPCNGDNAMGSSAVSNQNEKEVVLRSKHTAEASSSSMVAEGQELEQEQEQGSSKSLDCADSRLTNDMKCPSPSFSVRVRPVNGSPVPLHLHTLSGRVAQDDSVHHEAEVKVTSDKVSTRVSSHSSSSSSSGGDRVEKFRDLLNLHLERFEALSADPGKGTDSSENHRKDPVLRPNYEDDDLDQESAGPPVRVFEGKQLPSRTAPLSVDVTSCREYRRNVREFRHPRSIPGKDVSSYSRLTRSDRCDTSSSVDLTDDGSGKDDLLTGGGSNPGQHHVNFAADPEQMSVPAHVRQRPLNGLRPNDSHFLDSEREIERTSDRPQQSKQRHQRGSTSAALDQHPTSNPHPHSSSGDIDIHTNGNARVRKVERGAYGTSTLPSEHSQQYKEYCLELEYERYLYHFRREQDRVAQGLRAQRDFYQSLKATAPSVHTAAPQSAHQEHFQVPPSFSTPSSAHKLTPLSSQPPSPYTVPHEMEDMKVLEVLRSAQAALDISHVDMRHTHQKIIDLALKVDMLQLENRNLKHFNETSQAQSTCHTEKEEEDAPGRRV
jgi:hypothetical protein